MIPRLKETYQKKLAGELQKKLNLKNPNAVPKMEKIVINVGIGKMNQDGKAANIVIQELGKITGQKPVIAKAKKAIANFKLRQGMPVGVMVTLRQAKMYEFMDRLFNVALPRVKDFKGVSRKSFDEKGNYTMGVREYTIFPEIDIDKAERMFGMNITFVSKSKNKEEALELLSGLGMPFREK
ncbi:MAG: 50S ribosomal protein L5 [Bdellovibrionota bacterium]